MPTVNIGQLVATTLRNRMPEVADNMSDNVAFYNRLRRRGNIKMEEGGRVITQPLEYAENAAFQWYSGYETLNIGVNDFLDAAEFDWKQAQCPVSISGLEQLQNNGRFAVIKLLSSKIRNAQRTFANQMGKGVYADGTGTGGKEIGGLGLLVPTTVTNTVGGINANTWGFWQSQKLDMSTDLSLTMSATTILQGMNQAWYRTTRNNDKVDLILADNLAFGYFHSAMQTIQRVTSSTDATAGFTTLKFIGADVVLDGGLGYDAEGDGAGGVQTDHVASETMFFLNTNYFQFVTHSDRNIEIVGGERMSLNQDAMTQLMLWAGNMTISNRKQQLKLVP